MSRTRFTAAEKDAILAAAVGTPSGVIFEYAGMQFNLLAISNKESKVIFELINRLGAMTGGGNLNELKNVKDVDILTMLGSDAPRLIDTAKSMLFRSAFYGLDVDEENANGNIAVFDAWWDELNPIDCVLSVAPFIFKAAGLNTDRDAKRPTNGASTPQQPPKQSPKEEPEPEISTQETLPV